MAAHQAAGGGLDWRLVTTSWGNVWKAPAVWAVFLLHSYSNWFLYVMISWLPTYLAVERRLSLPGMAAGAAVPFLFAWIGTNTLPGPLTAPPPLAGKARKLFVLPYALAHHIFAVPRVESRRRGHRAAVRRDGAVSRRHAHLLQRFA